MTFHAPRTVPVLAAVLAALLLLPAPSQAAEDLPEGVVARVGNRMLTFDGFAQACAQHALRELKRSRSGPRSVLEQLIEEKLVRQECRRLGIEVTQADVNALWRDWDARLRRTSGGSRTLRDAIREQRTTQKEFLEQMWHILRKERVAAHAEYLGKTLPENETARLNQVGIVIAQVRDKADIRYGVKTLDHIQAKQEPEKLEPGVVVLVNGEPITMLDFGRALVIRLPGNKVREYLDKECKTGLLTIEGVQLEDEQLEDEVRHLRELWPLERELQRDEVWRTVSFKDRFETQFNMTMEDVRRSRYSRGLLGLVRRMRKGVTDEEVREEFEQHQDGRYGPHVLVYDVQFKFSQKRGIMAHQGLPSYREARKAATRIGVRLARGEDFDRVANEINMQRKPWMQAKRIRIYNTDRDLTLRRHAERLRDGDVSSPFDTLAEVHVMKRIGTRPARSLAEVRPHVVEMVARRKAREWIENRLEDPQWVQILWPLPQRGN